jgi:hypothetical protein
MTTDFNRFACWNSKQAGEVGFHTLGNRSSVEDALVLATKVEIPVKPYMGTETRSIDQIIDDFISTFEITTNNTIYAISGDSGSGKTFLIRCALARIEKDVRAHVVYVPRDNISLSTILRLVFAGLPGEAAKQALQELDSASIEDMPVDALVGLVYSRIQAELKVGYGRADLLAECAPEEEVVVKGLYGSFDEERKVYFNGLAEYLDQPDVKNHLIRKGGLLWNHVLSMRGENGDEIVNPISEDEIHFLSSRERKRLIDGNEDLEPFFLYLGENRRIAAAMIERVRESSIRNQVKLTRNLSEIFGDARAILKTQGKQLVLMFEDIARSGIGLSDAVYDLFRPSDDFQAEPIRVMFAVTTGYWPRVPPSIVNNLRRFDVQNLVAGDPEAESVGLEIISKYFNAARVGKDGLIEAWELSNDQDRGSGEWIPNKCTSCDFVETCHKEFGHVNGVGLFPLNQKAARHVLDWMQTINENSGYVGYSPRMIVKNLVLGWLRDSEAPLVNGNFPTAQIEEIVGELRGIEVRDFVSEDEFSRWGESMARRVMRARKVWTNWENTGEGCSPVLARAFDLDVVDTVVNPISRKDDSSPVLIPPDGSVKAQKSFENELSVLTAWANHPDKPELPPDKVNELRKFLVELVKTSLNLDRYLVSGHLELVKNLVDGLLGDNSIRIQGGRGDEEWEHRIQREIERSEDSYRMLAAAFWFIKTKSWNSTFEEGQTIYQCRPRTRINGRQLLMKWAEDYAQEVNLVIRRNLQEVLTRSLVVEFRLTQLEHGGESLGEDSEIVKSADLENLSTRLKNVGFDISDFVERSRQVKACSISARQEQGQTVLGEDLSTKIGVRELFTNNKEWLECAKISDINKFPAVAEEIEFFANQLSQFTKSCELSVSNFITVFENVDLGNLENEIKDLEQVFEFVFGRGWTNVDHEEVRQLVKMFKGTCGELQLSYSETTKVVNKMSDAKAWQLRTVHPNMDSWTNGYPRLVELMEFVLEELERKKSGQIAVDIAAVKDQINSTLVSVDSVLSELKNV